MHDLKLILMRHPPTRAPVGLCYGRFEPGLTKDWKSLVDSGLEIFAQEPQAIISSPSQRCYLPSCYLADKFALPQPQTDERLLEMNFGAWEGRLWQDIPRSESDFWANDYLRTAPPGGETMLEMQRRLLDWLRETRSTKLNRQKPLLLITHCGVIRILVAECLGLSLQNSFRMQIGFSSTTTILFSSHGNKLFSLNTPPICNHAEIL